MLSVGFDLVEIGRVCRALERPAFRSRVFGAEERAELAQRGFPAQSAAAAFSAKEAFGKAMGTGLHGFSLREVQLVHTSSGEPRLFLSGKAKQLAGGRSFAVSVTHTKEYAAAVVVAADGPACSPTPGGEGLRMLLESLKPRDPQSNKGSYGRLFSVCGSEGMAGAAVMSALSALRCGTGIVEVGLPRSIYPIVAAHAVEAVFTLLDAGTSAMKAPLKKATACLAGCGLGKSEAARQEISYLLESSHVPLVLDADGINLAAEHIDILKTARPRLILTPHPGEMARLLKTDVPDVQAHREPYAQAFAKEYGCILVLKGAGTLVASPDGRLYRNETGNPGMAKGGSGDVLAGMIAAFCAQGVELFTAAAGAVYLHGLAGDRCAKRLSQSAMLPTDLIAELPALFSEIGR